MATKKKAVKASAAKKATKSDAQYAYQIYEPINGHLSGKGNLDWCKKAVKEAYPTAKFVAEEATGRVLGQVDGGNMAVITLLNAQ
jgi:hypothetical protein